MSGAEVLDDVGQHLSGAGSFDRAAVPLGMYVAFLAQHGLLSEALFLTDIPRVGEWFGGKARTALRVQQLRALLADDSSDGSSSESLVEMSLKGSPTTVLQPRSA